jgi:hypothetical protein
MVGKGARAALVALFVVSGVTLGCSEDDDEAEGETESGSCNAIAAVFECYEVDGHPDAVAGEQEYCQVDAGDIWSGEPCPTTDLIGCCFYELGGDEYRDCYYVGHLDTPTALEQSCVESYAEWRPGSR